ncbi:Transcriptional regulatory moc3 [Fusarium albosuccineum]|uniref:Transcriptional regulatory moc3 n=1 Tax=Fusarium albosuccineum TaxID=1237068 RepID=A0A8H4L4I4_9HYPO|nr:Transcriptional regulatory moc3 [Fusarium albosuccineum]
MEPSGTIGSSGSLCNVSHRQKRFATKVRTGCTTCKIKCDEAKPSCYRCTSTGRKCDGYSLVPSPAPRGDPTVRQALYMFRTKIALSIASAADVGFWTYDILQTAEAFKTVQHAVAALAAAYHSSILSDGGDRMERQHFALTQYNKAISLLQNCINTPKSLTMEHRIVILMTNIVFICICAVQGSRREACLHLRSGLSLLRTWQSGIRKVVGSRATIAPIQGLTTIYTQLDTQARAIIGACILNKASPWLPHAAAIDDWGSGNLQTVTEAISQLERLYSCFVQAMPTSESVESAPYDRSQLLAKYRKQLQTWDLNFDRLTSGPDRPGFTKTLHLRRLLAGAYLEMKLNGGGDLGYYQQRVNDILNLAQEIVQDPGSPKIAVAFTPVGGLVEALYFVATEAKDDGTKTKAIGLLEKYPIVEGLWGSSIARAALNGEAVSY